MKPSPEFLIMTSGFGPDFFEFDDSVESEIDASLTVVEHKDVKKLKRFLDDALSGAASSDELHQFWLDSKASIYFTSSEGTVSFLKLIRERLEKHPNFQNLEQQE
jgi:hypothetical protein